MNSIPLQKQSNICPILQLVNIFIHIREKEKIPDCYKCEPDFSFFKYSIAYDTLGSLRNQDDNVKKIAK